MDAVRYKSKEDAINNLRININSKHGHAVLLKDSDGYYTEMHAGFPGNCCCVGHSDFIWREDGYTDESVLEELIDN